MISGLVLSILCAAGSAAAAAGVVPTAPGPGMSFKEGGDCTLSWNLDTSGKWTSFSVDLMSGSNTAMSPVTNVFKDRDGTKGETTYTWKCPSVTPHSAIYFYQFTQTGADTTWTTRFAITSPSGDVTPPANSVQPGGAQIPWGIGHLAGTNAESTPANTATTTPSATANTTALNTPSTPSASTTNSTNSTSATAAVANNTSAVTGAAGTYSSAPTQSNPPSSSSTSKNPSTFSPTISGPTTGSNNTATPTSDAGLVTLCKASTAVLSLAALLSVL